MVTPYRTKLSSKRDKHLQFVLLKVTKSDIEWSSPFFLPFRIPFHTHAQAHKLHVLVNTHSLIFRIIDFQSINIGYTQNRIENLLRDV